MHRTDESREGASRSTPNDAAAVALRLALGASIGGEHFADWDRVFDVASRELLAPLAWLRSGHVIRSDAPPRITRAWRRTALAAHLRGQQQLDLLRRTLAAMQTAAVEAVVLKGLPLGEILYGDPFVRCCADVDLYVPASQRTRAEVTLRSLGWRHVDGSPPWHETWTLWRGDAAFHLEMHSSLVSDHLAHLTVGSPTAVATPVGGEVVPAHAGAFVAPYLAAHLATHQMPPLLWLVDFATLWQRSSAELRAHAERAARSTGLGRYLAWARDRALLLDGASRGDQGALGALGIADGRRTDVHSIWRHLALAASLPHMVRLIGAFVAPRPSRRDLRVFARYTIARLRTRLRSLTGASRVYEGGRTGGTAGSAREQLGRPLRLEREELISLTGDVIRAGGAVWIRAPGGSMLPTISRGALVRVDAIPPEGIAKGSVVLALAWDGEPVMHRVVGIAEGSVTTRGDAAIHTDAPLPLSRVIGVATAVRDETGERVLGRRPSHSMAVTVLKLRRRVARVVRRAR